MCKESSPEVREVPAKEARIGDTVTRTGQIYEVVGDVDNLNAFVNWGDGESSGRIPLRWVTVTRTASKAPKELGSVGTATVRGVKGVVVIRTSDASQPWFSSVSVRGSRWHDDGDLSDYEPLVDGKKE